MKQVVLFVAVLLLIKPLWPLAEYVANYDYIVEYLCENRDKPYLDCDGKCYLAQQLAQEAEGNETNPFGGKRPVIEILFLESYNFSLDLTGGDREAFDPQNNFKTSQDLFSTLFATDMVQPPEQV